MGLGSEINLLFDELVTKKLWSVQRVGINFYSGVSELIIFEIKQQVKAMDRCSIYSFVLLSTAMQDAGKFKYRYEHFEVRFPNMLLVNYKQSQACDILEPDRLPVLFRTHLCTRIVRAKDKWLCAHIYVSHRNDLTQTREK